MERGEIVATKARLEVVRVCCTMHVARQCHEGALQATLPLELPQHLPPIVTCGRQSMVWGRTPVAASPTHVIGICIYFSDPCNLWCREMSRAPATGPPGRPSGMGNKEPSSRCLSRSPRDSAVLRRGSACRPSREGLSFGCKRRGLSLICDTFCHYSTCEVQIRSMDTTVTKAASHAPRP